MLNVIAGLLVFSRNLRLPINLWFFALALSCGAWVIGIAAFLKSNAAALAFDWAKFYYVAPLIISASSVIFAQTFPSGGKVNTKRSYLALAGGLVLILCVIFWPNFLFAGLIYQSWGKDILLKRFPYLIYSAYLVACFCITLLTIYRKTKKERGLHKAQAQSFFEGYFVSAILGLSFNLFLPWFGNYRFVWVGPLATTFYLVATAYGIVKHRLFDIRLAAARAAGYLLAVVVLGSLYGVLDFVVARTLNGQVASTRQLIVSATLAVILAITFRPVKLFFDRITNKIFYRDAYDTQAFIAQLNQALVENVDLDKLLTVVSSVIAQNLKASYCVIGIKETPFRDLRIIGTVQKKFSPEKIAAVRRITPHITHNVIITDYLPPEHANLRRLLEENDIAVLVRIASTAAVAREGVGYIALGAKKSGNAYGDQDVKILDIISKELLIAIQNALHYEEIENFNMTLQQKVEDATKRLRVSNRKLKMLDETKDDFISMASHQLRTPLTSVKGYLSLVLDGDAGRISPNQRKLLTQAFISSQRMVYLIADLLNVSRLKTGKFVIEPTPVNLADIVQDEVNQLVETAQSRSLTLTYHRPAHFPVLQLDETKIRQVAMNFMDNAIYYTPSGGHIEVRLTETPKMIELRIIDDGIGVPKDEQHHLFTKFFRAKNAQRARPDGTGLGLFMAQKVVVAQGGAIIFSSKEGQGSTFGFTFPKAKLQAVATESAPAA